MASIKDVASRAGVGVGTVSRFLNGTGYLSEEAKERINRAISELNYTPNELARNLFKKRTGIVAILVPDLSHPFFCEFTKYCEIELYKNNYKTMVCNTIEESNREKDYIEMLNRHMVDGIITGVHSLDMREYLNLSYPILALDRYIGDKIPIVGSDHQKGGMIAAQTFLNCGCRHVIQVRTSAKVPTSAHDRHTALRNYLELHGILVHTVELEWNHFDFPYFARTAAEILDHYPDMDGMFGSDFAAAAVLKEALNRGIKIPQDLKIIAYDGTYITDMIHPTLTVIVQPIELLAKSSVENILRMIAGQPPAQPQLILDVALKPGETT